MRTAGAIFTAALILIVTQPAEAFYADGYRQGPWCSGQSIGWSWVENCTLPSLEVCRREVIAGNRGVCFQNPSWVAQAPPAPHTKRKQRR